MCLVKNPHMFAAQPNILINTKNKEATKQYLEWRKLEIFLVVCCNDYIGTESFDKSLSVQDVCGEIS